MGTPITRYLGGRPMPGTGMAQDYFRNPPNLSYLGYGAADDQAYGMDMPDDSYALAPQQPDPSFLQRVRKANVAGNKLSNEDALMLHQMEYGDSKASSNAARNRYDAAWAMHYLNRADPTSPDFSAGLTRMFQQFPGAANDPHLMRQVQLMREINPVSKIHPDAQKLYRTITSLRPDDPDYAEKHSQAVAEAGEHAFDPRMASFIDRTSQHAMAMQQRKNQIAEKEKTDLDRLQSQLKIVPEAIGIVNKRVAAGEDRRKVLNELKEIQAYAPISNDMMEHRDFWRRYAAGEKPEELGKEYENKKILLGNNIDPEAFGIVDQNGKIDDSKMTDLRSHLERYGEDPSAAIDRIKGSARFTKAEGLLQKFQDISARIDMDPYSLIRASRSRNGRDEVQIPDEAINEEYGGAENVMKYANSIRANLLNAAAKMVPTLRSQGFKQNEIYNQLQQYGYKPEELGVTRKPFRHEPQIMGPPEPPVRRSQSTEMQRTPNRIQIEQARLKGVDPAALEFLYGKDSAEKILNPGQ